MQRRDFHYDLPSELVAQHPSARRGDCRLLCLRGEDGALADRVFGDLPEILKEGDLLVFNDTRVLRARLFAHKNTGGKVEILVERVLDGCRALVQVRASKSAKIGTRMRLDNGDQIEVIARRGDFCEVQILGSRRVHDVLEVAGQVPLPPYIERAPEAEDAERYQTIYARRPGAVAAPTAGLHFDGELMADLARRGVEMAFLTLHVGAGTFQPMRAERIEDHVMHRESVQVSPGVCEQVRAARDRGGRVVAVGTTSVRALEAASASGEPRPLIGDTSVFIYPGYRFRSVDAMITNFHLPESTLLILVCAFAGREPVLRAYRHAIERRYRFYSYGDAMFITPHAL